MIPIFGSCNETHSIEMLSNSSPKQHKNSIFGIEVNNEFWICKIWAIGTNKKCSPKWYILCEANASHSFRFLLPYDLVVHTQAHTNLDFNINIWMCERIECVIFVSCSVICSISGKKKRHHPSLTSSIEGFLGFFSFRLTSDCFIWNSSFWSLPLIHDLYLALVNDDGTPVS